MSRLAIRAIAKSAKPLSGIQQGRLDGWIPINLSAFSGMTKKQLRLISHFAIVIVL